MSSIRAQVRHDVLTEAGYRCAIPVCQVPITEVHHIVPRAEGGKDSFENLIALCPNCHRRYHSGEISRESIRQYKANLTVINGRYCDFELRLLRRFYESPKADTVKLAGGDEVRILLMNLLHDEFLVAGGAGAVILEGIPAARIYHLTAAGRKFINKWFHAKTLG